MVGQHLYYYHFFYAYKGNPKKETGTVWETVIIRGFPSAKVIFKTKPALSKNERKSLLRAGHCARLFERNADIYYFKYPHGASSAAP